MHDPFLQCCSFYTAHCFIVSLHSHCTNLLLLHHCIVLHILHHLLHDIRYGFVSLFHCILIVETNLPILHHRIVLHVLHDIQHGIVSDSAVSPMWLRRWQASPCEGEEGTLPLQHHPFQQPSDEEPSSCEKARGGNILPQYHPLLLNHGIEPGRS